MRVLIPLLVVLGLAWLWRRNQHQTPPGPTPPAPQDMVNCPVCGVHLPMADATAGKKNHYCSAEHRQLAEG